MHKVVMTEGERERRYSNAVNKRFRHCQIGKVVLKRDQRLPWREPIPFGIPGYKPSMIWPHLGTPLPTQTYMPNTCSAPE